MALRYIDSMGDHYTAADASLKWTSTLGLISRVSGMHGYGLKGSLSKGMLFGSRTIIMEVYLSRTASTRIFTLGDTLQQEQCSLSVNSDGGIEARRFHGTPSLALIAQSAPDLVRTGIWYHLAWKVYVDPTAGSVEVRLNGGVVINVTGVDTTATTWNSLLWSGAVGSFTIGDNAAAATFDDLVVMDDVDDAINDLRLPGGGGFDKFLGPVEITVKRANGAGLLAEWTGVPSAPNYQNVDEVDPDGDTTHNAADATDVGASDLFAMENLTPVEDVVAVQSLVLARKTEEGVAAIAKLVHDSGTTTVGTTVHQPNTYSYMIEPEPKLPDGSLWTAARWNAIQYGYRRMV
jgi:hypothetical protein